MKSEFKIFIAFILNILFSVIEFIGGILTNSISIISDSVHDFGDAFSIGLSYFLEKKSKKKPDNVYTYGYVRYSVLGAFITSVILTTGSIFIILNSINRLINPEKVNYNGMIILAILGIVINFSATYFTRKGKSLNQKSINLHMLEDVLNWVIVLVGAVLIKLTKISVIDPILSLFVAVFILKSATKNLKLIVDLFLEKVPNHISIDKIKKQLLLLEEVSDIHHVHVWSMDGVNNYATIHVVTKSKNKISIKKEIRNIFKKFNITHVTIELEDEKEHCSSVICKIDNK